MAKGKLLDKLIQKISHRLPQAPSGLDKYDIVVVGSNLGGLLTKNISKIDHGHLH